MFLLFKSFPMFSAFVLSPSFVDIPISTGLFFLRCDLTAVSTGVSYIDEASFAIWFP